MPFATCLLSFIDTISAAVVVAALTPLDSVAIFTAHALRHCFRAQLPDMLLHFRSLANSV